MSGIYLDHAATTPMLENAIAAMDAQLRRLGNPSSLHTQGRHTRKDIEDAREILAKELDCLASEIIFTASGTEAIYGQQKSLGKNVVVISSIEHHATLDPAAWLAEHEGAEVIHAPVTRDGVIDLEFLRKLVASRGSEIALISIMHANNETGAIQPIAEVVKIAGDIPVHTDAAQSFKKVPLSFKSLGVIALSISAHKIGGPLGIGALVLRRGVEIPALLHGGGQEREIRSGTLNAPAIVSLATAAQDKSYDADAIAKIRDDFAKRVTQVVPGSFVNAINANRLPGIVNVTFPGTQSDTLLLLMDGEKVSCSTGSACSAGVHRPSHVLMAMGHDEISAMSSLRFSFGRTSTQADCDGALAVLPSVISRGRAASGV